MPTNLPEKKKITIQYIEEEVNKVYLLVDKGIIRIILSTILGNRLKMSDKPIWLLILAGSSAGKTSLMDIINNCGNWIISIDTLTTNTFASGLKRDEETSLLHKANDGILVFKDFTTLTSMNEEGLREIMGQLRAIYDGSFNKKTGNNVEVNWKGKIGIIAGGTGAAARKMRQFSEQGERFINYILNVADPEEMAIRAMNNIADLKEKEEHLRDIVAEFINDKLKEVRTEALTISKELQLQMIKMANFATLARSPVIMDKKDPTMVAFVGEREMPSRMAMMLSNLATALMIIDDEKTLTDFSASILYKTALDSIPVERRMVLKILAEFRTANTKAIAIKLHYDSTIVRAWCNQLNALKMVTRKSGGRGKGVSDIWEMLPEFKETMCRYENIQEKDEVLSVDDDEDDEYENAYSTKEQKSVAHYEQIADELTGAGFDFKDMFPEEPNK